MTTIPLTPNYSLGIAHYQKLRVRLIVFKNGEEYVCRKESLFKVKQLLALDEGRAFKGRLQLVKDGDGIVVEVKGEVVGVVKPGDLEKLLDTSV